MNLLRKGFSLFSSTISTLAVPTQNGRALQLGIATAGSASSIPAGSSTIFGLAGSSKNVRIQQLDPAFVSRWVNPSPQITGLLGPTLWNSLFSRDYASLQRMHKTGPYMKTRKKPRPLDGKPFMKGVVLKTLIKKPKKPNSANRKCVLVKLSSGKEMVAYVPGIGHNLQEHNIVLCRVGRVKDCPGVKIKCVRGKYDLPHVIKQDTS